MDFLRVKYIKLQDIAKRTTLKGCNYLNAALSQKRGAILVTGHLGNWELAGIYLSSLGYPLSAVVEDIPAMNNFLNSLRVKTGMEVILTSQPQAIINAIKKNRIVVLLADRPVTQHGIEISFLNGRKKIPLGPAYFAYRFKVPVLVGYFVYTSNANCFAAEIVPLSFPEDLNIKMLTIALIKQLSSYISKYPTQWFVMRNEWC
jgi:KDO2-lipid IV(A) lauroyltransferase